ncbi:MAG: hypothetical protein JO166_07170 [Deltaproteobacteria bacterium]|nr:hypothetical protein [Deltaproteobacteria bacterium]
MKQRVALAAFIFIPALCGSCAVQGSPFNKTAAPPGEAVIYVYRPYHYAASLLRPPVTCGEDMARIGPGGYHVFTVPAGEKTECSVQWTETSDQVEIDGGKRVYYIREEIGWGVLSGHPHLDPVDADQAKSEIQQCCVEEEPAS